VVCTRPVRSSFVLGCALLACCAPLRPLTTPRPAPQPALTLGSDSHIHVTMSHQANPLFKGEPGDGPFSASPRARLTNQLDAPTLKAAGVRLLFAALWPPIRARPGRSSLDESLNQVRQLDEFVGRNGSFAVVHTVAEARRALGVGRIAMFPQIEGGEGLGSVEDVDLFYAAGVRGVTLVHFESTQLAGAAKGQLARAVFGLHTSTLEERGLSELGKAVVTRMAELGIVIDLSHASDRTVADVLDITTPRGVPVIVSHTGARAMMPDLERNLSDENARRVVQGGGLIGVSLFTAQLDTPADQQLPGHQAGTCDDAVAHWKHFAAVVGPDALMLGSDFNGFIVRPIAGGLCADGIRNTGDLPQLWAALVAQGVPREALDGMGEKLLGLVSAVEAKADPAAQARAMLRARDLRAAPSLLDVPSP